jgi:hypothetical protein
MNGFDLPQSDPWNSVHGHERLFERGLLNVGKLAAVHLGKMAGSTRPVGDVRRANLDCSLMAACRCP